VYADGLTLSSFPQDNTQKIKKSKISKEINDIPA
jgi:hypothetical protein